MQGVSIPIKNAKIRFRLRGQIFDTSSIPGGNTFPFEIPITKETQKTFGHPELLANREILGSTFENVKLLYKGHPLLTGYVLFLSAKTNYRVTFNFGVAGIKPLGNRKLRSFALGGPRTPNFPSGFYGLQYHADLVAANPNDYDYLFPCVRNPQIYHDTELWLVGFLLGTEYLNYYINGAYKTISQPGGSYPYRNYGHHYLPFVKLDYLLREIFAEVGIRFESSWLEDEEIQNLIIHTTTSEYTPGTWNPGSQTLLIQPTVFNLNKYLPDITVSELLNTLRNQFNLFFNWNFFDNSCTLDAFRDIHKQTDAWDITERIIGTPQIEPGTEAIKNLKYQTESTDFLAIDENLISLINDVDGQDVDLKGSLIAMEENLDNASAQTRSFFLPTSEQPGNSEDIPPGENLTAQFGLRLLFYRGMQPDSNANNYPLATPGDRRFGDIEIGGTNYTLYPGGEKGLYNVWWKDYDEFKQNARKVSYQVKIELDDILRLDLRKKVRIKDSLFYINEVQFELGNSISPADFEFFRI